MIIIFIFLEVNATFKRVFDLVTRFHFHIQIYLQLEGVGGVIFTRLFLLICQLLTRLFLIIHPFLLSLTQYLFIFLRFEILVHR
jgi:hypothetical protein